MPRPSPVPHAPRTAQTRDLRVGSLSTRAPTPFDIVPDAATCQAIAHEFGLTALRKLRFRGQVTAQGKSGWLLTAALGATIVQECGLTLDPVTTRIDEDVTRQYLPELPQAEEHRTESGEIEVEMPEDDTLEPLGTTISPWAVMVEALSLAIPPFPRSPGATTDDMVYAEPGVTPMRDEDARPFAGLAGLRDSLAGDGGDDPKDRDEDSDPS